MSVIINGTDGVQFNDSSLQGAAASPYVLKNRIINGAMEIDQRNAGASVTNSNSPVYTLDRLGSYGTIASKFTVQQNAGSVTPPTGFKNYAGVTSSSSYSVGVSETFLIYQSIEGYNVADFNIGTANASTIAISFWVRSSLTGTHSGSLQNSAQNRSYVFDYTISSANTWEYKTVTVTLDTSGTWLTNNGTGLQLRFGLGSGTNLKTTAGSWVNGDYVQSTSSVSIVGTSGATFYITGVQLEIGTTATPFERRLYNQELANCQRYCPMFGPVVADSFSAVGYTISTTLGRVIFQFPVTARTAPTGITVTTVSGFYLVPPFARQASAVTFSESNTQYASVDITTTGLTANQPTTLRIGTGGSKIEFTGCEL